MKIRTTLLFTALPLVCLGAAIPAHAEVTVESPWVREAPPTAKMLASYMVLRNKGDSVEVLEDVEASGFEEVQIHRTTIHDGVASMEEQDNLPIPPQGSVELAPGGYHLMLMMGDHPLKEGEVVKLTLSFKDGKTLEIQAPVRKDATAPEGHGDDHEHHMNHHEEHHHDH